MKADLTKEIIANLYDDVSDASPVVWHGETTHRYSVITHSGVVIASGVGFDGARTIRDMWFVDAGERCDIIETETKHLPDGKVLFSGENSDILPHVRVYASHDDPMAVETFMWSWEDYFEDLHSLDPLPPIDPVFFDQKPPLVRATIVRKPVRVKSVTRERSYAAISDPKILAERGFVVIDVRTQERVYTGTKKLCMDYIAQRNLRGSRDKLPVQFIRVVKFSDYAAYQAQVENEGFVARIGSEKIAIGLVDEVKKALSFLAKAKKISIQRVKVARTSAVDLWWVQNRMREVAR